RNRQEPARAGVAHDGGNARLANSLDSTTGQRHTTPARRVCRSVWWALATPGGARLFTGFTRAIAAPYGARGASRCGSTAISGSGGRTGAPPNRRDRSAGVRRIGGPVGSVH